MAALDNTTRGYVVGLGVITAGIFAAMSLARPDFLTFDNLNSMAFQFPEFGTLALAVLLSMISGGIDLSVVSTANLASIVAAKIMHAEAGGSAWAAIPCALAVGAACGGLNGLLVAFLGLPPILATLGTMQLFSGIGIVMTKGSSVTGLPDWFTDFGITSFSSGFRFRRRFSPQWRFRPDCSSPSRSWGCERGCSAPIRSPPGSPGCRCGR